MYRVWILFSICFLQIPSRECGIFPSASWILTQTQSIQNALMSYTQCMTKAQSFPNIPPHSAVGLELNQIRDSMESLKKCTILTVIICGPRRHLKATAHLARIIMLNPSLFGEVVGSPIKCGIRMTCILNPIVGCKQSNMNNPHLLMMEQYGQRPISPHPGYHMVNQPQYFQVPNTMIVQPQLMPGTRYLPPVGRPFVNSVEMNHLPLIVTTERVYLGTDVDKPLRNLPNNVPHLDAKYSLSTGASNPKSLNFSYAWTLNGRH